MAGWTCRDKETNCWDGTLCANRFVGDGSRLTNVVSSITLDQVGNPLTDVDFNFGNNKSLTFRSVDRTPIADEGTFNFEARGNFTGDLVHIHQHTGNAGVGTVGLRIECEDSDICPLVVSGACTTTAKFNKDIIVNGVNVVTSSAEVITIANNNTTSAALNLALGTNTSSALATHATDYTDPHGANILMTGTVSAANLIATNNVSGALIYGDGSNLTNLPGGGADPIWASGANFVQPLDTSKTVSCANLSATNWRVESTSNPGTTLLRTSDDPGGFAGYILTGDTFIGSITNGAYLMLSDSGGTGYAAISANQSIQLQITGSVKMHMDSTGKVGINDVTPAEKLDVGGNVRADDYLEYSKPLPEGEALPVVMAMKNKEDGTLDHKSFPNYKEVEVTNNEGEKIIKKSVSLSAQVKYSIKAIQELKAEIDKLKNE